MADDASTMPLLLGTAASFVVINLVLRRRTGSFKRDACNNSFAGTLTGSFNLLANKDSVLSRDGVKSSIEGYERLFAGARKNVGATSHDASIKTREKEYKTMVNSFYDLVTDFYEWGWGQCFHFAPRWVGETFVESIKRAEYYLALRAGLTADKKAIDVGCGVGGPMRNIQQFTGADITGVTINDYQVRVGNQYCAQKGIADKCRLIQGDFQKLPSLFDDEVFDIAYAIEATCHSPDRVACFSGVNRLLKKGGMFVGYEWIVLPERGFDSKNPDHVRIKEGIEVGNGLPTLATSADIIKSLEDSGFEVLESFDANQNVNSKHEIPWYQTLQGSFSPRGFRMTRLGRMCTHMLVTILETLRIAPKGSIRVSSLLNATALDLVEGGEKELFTPSFFFMARKK
mmetsp:Transcript_24644/g.44598  ORF Transcript_24644/g.44598 Transcript_24644/m.44598 type:complete len:400 (-) Transcript_24644:289-1488(-)|eukprot:CAMPEP_0198286006 /NCGR_PEP_ID=MMETSP1449-20131203/5189_1 /TAXON_ID=420275 /ORGANISM="Attheya septentrionalis, Strain CCMP2084" /LENGTH=399 /DNA_ID=CAMNT_0043983625 /DNA_START=121 /DNA_END=1320 /DNA_ORIENTATION=-